MGSRLVVGPLAVGRFGGLRDADRGEDKETRRGGDKEILVLAVGLIAVGWWFLGVALCFSGDVSSTGAGGST